MINFAKLYLKGLLLAGLCFSSTAASAYQIQNRWVTTATNGSTGVRGNPITVTWGLVADGTTVSGSEGSSGSSLISFLDAEIGAGPGGADLTERPWFPIFTDSFARLSAISGLTYIYEPNNSSHSIDSSTSPTGQLGVRPDVRIGGHSIDGQAGANTLAYNYFPDHGDMVLDTDNSNHYGNANNNYRAFRNILMHEAGHGVGINHVVSNNAAFLLEPNLSTSFDGPQLDDILGLQRNYGDALEKNSGNDSFGNATLLGSLAPSQTLSIGTRGDATAVTSGQTDFISIDGTTDTDFFSFTLERTLDVVLHLTPRGASYNQGPQGGGQSLFNTKSLSNLALALLDTNGTTVLDLANLNGAGLGESISRQLAAGTYFARVTATTDNVQLYGLDILGSRVAADLLWTGNESNDWDVDTSVNFADEAGPVAFFDLDHVTFDDTAETFNVNITEDVEPTTIVVDTEGTYVFSGAGGIVGGSLTKTGVGTLELANDGNSYSGPTEVEEGTLIVVSTTGMGNTTVHDDANLAGGGAVGGNLIALAGALIQPGESLVPASVDQDSMLMVDGDFNLQSNATLQVELRGDDDFDSLLVAGVATLSGGLDVLLSESFAAAIGGRYDILSATGGLSGVFESVMLPVPGPFLAFDILYDLDAVSLVVVPALSGDFDLDGDLDGDDFIAWQRGNSPNPLSQEDFNVWYNGYLNQLAELQARGNQVPEPSGWMLLAMAVVIGSQAVSRWK